MDNLTRKMTRTEYNELTDEEKKERKRLNSIIRTRKYRENNPEKVKEQNKKANKKYSENHPEKLKEQKNKASKKYRENNPEKIKKYREEHSEYNRQYKQTPAGKKSNKLADWKHSDLQESKEDLEWIYELYLHQEFCYSCDVKLTRNGDNHPTQACMDHDHITHRFRQICCRACNNSDSWMKYWC